MNPITEEYERQLWGELNSQLADAVPVGAREEDAERAIMLAIMGHDTEIHALHSKVRRVARERAGYLREKLGERNQLSRARRRLYGRWG